MFSSYRWIINVKSFCLWCWGSNSGLTHPGKLNPQMLMRYLLSTSLHFMLTTLTMMEKSGEIKQNKTVEMAITCWAHDNQRLSSGFLRGENELRWRLWGVRRFCYEVR